jgi:acetyl-CoA synthetase
MTASTNPALTAFRAARDTLLRHRTDYAAAVREFGWPELTHFNFALDHFDDLARGPQRDQLALWIVADDGQEEKLTYAELSARSNQVANWLESLGVQRGDRVLLMLGNEIPLWELMLACIKIGAVMIPATSLLSRDDLIDRFERGQARVVVTGTAQCAKFDGLDRYAPKGLIRITVGGGGDSKDDWLSYEGSRNPSAEYTPRVPTKADEPLLLYFTSGTTSKPKLVEHGHTSYPVGHLSTMYWIGLQPGDVHWNISSPGWGKHAWSCFFAPFIAGATVFIFNYARFDAKRVLDVLVGKGVHTLCAPPTVWRMLIQENLSQYPVKLRELLSAGEPLNPEVIEQVRAAWGITIRDGFGQTETTCAVGNSPGQVLKFGSMGRPMPGYPIVLLDPDGKPADEGEICIDLAQRPTGLMKGYFGDAEKNAEVMRDGHYHTGDVASRDADGYITYVGRADDVFKASDYRISPFELESVLIEHPAVAEAAVVPSPDPLKLAVPKAFVALAPGHPANEATAMAILQFCRDKLAPYKRIRRLEFFELPKTISGKIRRVEMRKREAARPVPVVRGANEFFDDALKTD